MKTLKLVNTPMVVLYVIWCTALLFVCYDSPVDFWTSLTSKFKALNAKDGVVVAMSPLLTLVTVGLLPPGLKAALVFWRIRDVLPGHRAFSIHAHKDARINVEALRQRVVPWPSTPAEENQTWYSLYKAYSEAPAVQDAHRSYLLSRELAACSVVFLFLGGAVLAVSGTLQWAGIFSLIMLAQLTVLALAGRNNGLRFVRNVLSEASHSRADA